ncbi:putative lipoprotein [Nautilia profundicola AmH]|uniref:Lipoprotein n=1 Tax=Nautilia profundicola (strain ATCC BAA-1463 / DSM 18972 / AmH) TaxID=598659 RepID=B9L6G6_NAUPA|nr:alpha/beta hydrolase [Nautilia profundicola]ACM93200.1 putative lipoprotein [Nautilia profundicola AmH]
MKKFIYFLIFFFWVGCGYNIPTPSQRVENADKLVQNRMKNHIFKTSEFKIFSYEGNLSECKTVYVFIEGDGLSWITSELISDNPTPLNPKALKLTLNDKHRCKIYLARPCQYVKDTKCNYKYWTDYRFSKEVIRSYQEVLDNLKRQYNINSFVIIGYSGGGAIAALVSAFRNDVDLLVTIAGNLDTAKWCRLHYLSPLKHSMNPADFTDKLTNQKQLHFIGAEDKIVNKEVFFSYYSKFKNKKNIKYKILEGYKHNSDWSEVLDSIEK